MSADLLKGFPEIMGHELKGKDTGLVPLRDIMLCTLASWAFHTAVSLIPGIER